MNDEANQHGYQQYGNGTLPPAASGRKKWLMPAILVAVLVIAGVMGGAWWQRRQDNQEKARKEKAAVEFHRESEGVIKFAMQRQVLIAAAVDKSCGYTQATSEGSYYIANSPALMDGNLNYDNLPGEKIALTGYVYGAADNSHPIANAKVELWQADDAGNFHPNSNGDASTIKADTLALRGYVMTDENGRYQFQSIYPGQTANRTRHIYVKVSAKGFVDITTQAILAKAEDTIQPSEDMVAKDLNLSCARPEMQEFQVGVAQGIFNLHLRSK